MGARQSRFRPSLMYVGIEVSTSIPREMAVNGSPRTLAIRLKCAAAMWLFTDPWRQTKTTVVLPFPSSGSAAKAGGRKAEARSARPAANEVRTDGLRKRCDMVVAFRLLRPSALGNGGFVERGTHTPRQLQCIVIGPEVDEEHARLLVEHVAVDRRDFDVAAAQGSDEGIDLVAGDQESPVIAALPPPVGWKLIAFALPSAGLTAMPPSVAGSRRGMPTWYTPPVALPLARMISSASSRLYSSA